MFFVKYGKKYLHNPKSDVLLTDASLEVEVNSAGSFAFTMYDGHPLFNGLKERDTKNPVTVWQDDVLLFTGDILSIESGFHLSKKVECRGILGWLNDTIVKPYSTLEYESSNVAPNGMSGFFAWLIDNHNDQVERTKRFRVDVNEGQALDSYIYRSDSSYKTTGEVIKSSILEPAGGYLVVRDEENEHVIDFIREFQKDNAQLIDFGVNLLDYTSTDTTDDMATFVVPVGCEIEKRKDNTDKDKISQKLTIGRGAVSGLKNIRDNRASEVKEAQKAYDDASSDTKAEKKKELDEAKEAYNKAVAAYEEAQTITLDGCPQDGFWKSGDIIYSQDAVNKHGWIGAVVEFSEVTTIPKLIDNGILALKGLMSPIRTIEVKAIDLSMIKPDYEPIYIGQYVRVRSKPHDFDSYMLCTKIKYDLNKPDNNTFTLGQTFDLLTGISNRRINALNATVNHVFQAADRISAEAKAGAIAAAKAQEEAENATLVAGSANDIAGSANKTAEQALADAAAVREIANNAKQEASNAVSSAKDAADKATEAKLIADEATANISLIQTNITTIQNSANQAIQDAADAKTAADAADAAAKEAKNEAETAKAAASGAQAKANEAYTAAGNVASQVGTINNEIADVRGDADSLSAAIQGKIDVVTNTMTAEYTKKTELTSTEETLRSEITTSAAGIKNEVEQTYAKKTELTEVQSGLSTRIDQNAQSISSTASSVEEVRINASSAKTAADAASAAAATAQTTAEAARENAEEAQAAANSATAAAATAQQKATKAAEDLATAESNLAALQNQANVTDEHLEAAKTAVANAQSAAEAAQADATAAAGVASAAQTAASNAKLDAEKAKADAANAKTAADNAQADVDTLKNRVSTAETSITQNSEQIALRATKTELTSAVDGIAIGGRNLLRYTGYLKKGSSTRADDGISAYNDNTQLESTDEGIKYSFAGVANDGITVPIAYDDCIKNGETVTLSFDYRGTIDEFGALYFLQRTSPNVSFHPTVPMIPSETEWQHYECMFSSDNVNDRTFYKLLMLTHTASNATDADWIEIKRNSLKMERGNKSTDWTPAIEDVASDINDLSLQMSLDAEEMRLDFARSITSATNELADKMNATDAALTDSIEQINKYIRFVDGKIILGEEGNELILTIQNDRVSFTQGGNEVAYFSDNKLYINQAEVLRTFRLGKFDLAPNGGNLELTVRR